MRPVLLMALALTACPPSMAVDAGAPDAGWALTEAQAVSGSRLRARYLVPESGGGTKVFLGFQDTQRNEACEVLEIGADARACVPVDVYGADYEDSACTRPVVGREIDSCSRPAPRYLFQAGVSLACAPPPKARVFRLTKLAVAPTRLFGNNGGPCIEVNAAPSPTAEWFAGTEELPLEAFAAFTEVVEPRGALEARVLVSADGARQLHRVHLAGDSAPAEASLTSDAGLRWLPSVRSYHLPGFFGDTMCSRPGALFSELCGEPPPLLAGTHDSTACTATSVQGRVRVGARVGAGYSVNQGTCEAAAPPFQGAAAYLLGEPVPNTEFPQANQRVEGTQRLTSAVLVDSAGRPLRPPYWFSDTTLGARCYPRELEGVGLRCTPAASQESERVYADPACQRPALALPAPSAGCGLVVPPVVELVLQLSSACAPRLFKTGAPHSGSIYARDGAGQCAQTPRVAGETYLSLEPLPNTMLERLNVSTE